MTAPLTYSSPKNTKEKACTDPKILNFHSFVRNLFLITYYATSFKVKLWLDHFGSQSNSEKIDSLYLICFEK